MTASERLRALDEGLRQARKLGMTYPRGGPWAPIEDALPLIADCIALAEDVAETDKPLWGTKDGVGFKLQNALADLREHLDSGTPDREEVVGPRGQDSAISAEPPPEHLEGGDDG